MPLTPSLSYVSAPQRVVPFQAEGVAPGWEEKKGSLSS